MALMVLVLFGLFAANVLLIFCLQRRNHAFVNEMRTLCNSGPTA
jgi:hypothetical protein